MCYSALVSTDIKHLAKKYSAKIKQNVHVSNLSESITNLHSNSKANLGTTARIYPGSYAPIIYDDNGDMAIKMMRYGAFPPPTAHSKNLTTYNARRDNLKSAFWSSAFMCHHGFVVLKKFYEWVRVDDLLKANVVSLKDVEEEFEKQREIRKKKLIEAGKKFKPTATELKDPLTRHIVIEFSPVTDTEMLSPVIFNFSPISHASENPDMGFAIVTDDPPSDVSQAGHDRCPVILQWEKFQSWLYPSDFKKEDLIHLLGQKKQFEFHHRLAKE